MARTIISEFKEFAAAEHAVSSVLSESESYDREKVKKEVMKYAKSPEKVKSFVEKNQQRFQQAVERADEKQKPFLQRTWDYLCYAVGKGTKFVSDHLAQILSLIAIAAAGIYCFPYLKQNWQKAEDVLSKKKDQQPGQIPQQDSKESPQPQAKGHGAISDIPYPLDFTTKLLEDPDSLSFLSDQQKENLKKLKDNGGNVFMWIYKYSSEDGGESDQSDLIISNSDIEYTYNRITRNAKTNYFDTKTYSHLLKQRKSKIHKLLEMSDKSPEEFKAFIDKTIGAGSKQIKLQAFIKDPEKILSYEKAAESMLQNRVNVFDEMPDDFKFSAQEKLHGMRVASTYEHTLADEDKFAIQAWIDEPTKDSYKSVFGRSAAFRNAVKKAKAGDGKELSDILIAANEYNKTSPNGLYNVQRNDTRIPFTYKQMSYQGYDVSSAKDEVLNSIVSRIVDQYKYFTGKTVQFTEDDKNKLMNAITSGKIKCFRPIDIDRVENKDGTLTFLIQPEQEEIHKFTDQHNKDLDFRIVSDKSLIDFLKSLKPEEFKGATWEFFLPPNRFITHYSNKDQDEGPRGRRQIGKRLLTGNPDYWEPAPKQETPKQEPPKEQQPKQETPKQEPPKQEPPKEQQPKKETPKQETPKEQQPKKETPKQEMPKWLRDLGGNLDDYPTVQQKPSSQIKESWYARQSSQSKLKKRI